MNFCLWCFCTVRICKCMGFREGTVTHCELYLAWMRTSRVPVSVSPGTLRGDLMFLELSLCLSAVCESLVVHLYQKRGIDSLKHFNCSVYIEVSHFELIFDGSRCISLYWLGFLGCLQKCQITVYFIEACYMFSFVRYNHCKWLLLLWSMLLHFLKTFYWSHWF